eukprot:scaffold217768_cov26-Tisochrysis_lutea.AAC.1
MSSLTNLSDTEQTQAVESLCKTFSATTTKMIYAFSALSEMHSESKARKNASVDAALASSGHSVLIDRIASTLAAGVEEIIRSREIAIRSAVLEDLRARFVSNDPPKRLELNIDADGMLFKSGGLAKSEPTDVEQLLKEDFQGNLQETKGKGADEESSTGLEYLPAAKSSPSTLYERQKAWEARKEARLEAERKKADEAVQKELQKRPDPHRPGVKLYAHVESVLKKERVALENARVAQAEAIAHEALMAKEHAEKVAEHERMLASMSEEGRLEAERARAAALEACQAAHKEARRAEAKYQELLQEVENDKKARADAKEILDALDGREFESWPMFPGKKVLRVKEHKEFDGRCSAEFRCKDDESGERGVSFFMGRVYSTREVMPQCVLFDENIFSDLDAARWWARNSSRKCFESTKAELIRQQPRTPNSRGISLGHSDIA